MARNWPTKIGLVTLVQAAILQIGGDPGAPEGVIVDGGLDTGLAGPALDHIERIAPRQGSIR